MAKSGSVELSSEESDDLQVVTRATNKFAISLYNALARKETGNVIVSPLSVQIVLALAYIGTGGETAKELKTLLSLPDKIHNTCIGYHSLLKFLQAPVLKLVNCIFVDAKARIKEDFQEKAKKCFISSAEATNFLTEPEKSRQNINKWVENQTNKKITNLLAPGTVENSTRFIMVNAIHFKANWSKRFNKGDTRKEPFHVSKSRTINIQMMHAKKDFGFTYDKQLKIKCIDLNYEGWNFHMLVILPDDIEGLSELERRLDELNFVEKVKNMEVIPVIVALPKFTTENTMELNEILMSQGIPTMFDHTRADFSGLSEESLYVSKIVQKAFVEVNEEGTEAAAATGLQVELCSMTRPPPPVHFIADHPFIFLIMKDDMPLFMGRVVHPNQ